jgi:dihydropyrimidine dehydrogenase (NAD+) subunit PreA
MHGHRVGKEVSTLPVIVKLTPNVTHIVPPGTPRRKAVPMRFAYQHDQLGDGRRCRHDDPVSRTSTGWPRTAVTAVPAVKPIALNMVSELARDAEFNIPISGIGGINNWRDAVEFLLLGAGNVQVCTAVMHYGYRIVEDMIDGLNNYLDERDLRR